MGRNVMRTRKKSWEQRQRERKLRMRQAIANETPEKRATRLENLRRSMKQVRASETPEQRATRLAYNRERVRRVRARKRQDLKNALLQQQLSKRKVGGGRRTGGGGGEGGGRGRPRPKHGSGRGGKRTWEALEEAARRLLGDRWTLLETLMSERKSGISVEEASDLFPREIRQGLIHVCCLCHGLLFQKSKTKTARVKVEETSAEELDCASEEEAPCPHTDTVQLCLM